MKKIDTVISNQIGCLPTFIIIGAARSGTTSLHYALDTHPQIYMSPIKETNYFLYHGTNEQPSSIGIAAREQLANSSATTIEKYLSCFQGASKNSAIGETSPAYLWTPEVPERINQLIPDAKLIVILRHPVESAYSRYLYAASRSDEIISDDFSEILERNEKTVKSAGAGTSLLDGNFHYQNLKRFFDIFDQDQIKVCLFEELQQENFFSGIFKFLGVNENHTPDVTTRYNQSGYNRKTTLHKIKHAAQPIKKIVRRCLPHHAYMNLIRVYHKYIVGKAPQAKKLSPEKRTELTKRYFKDDIMQLQNLIGRDLSHWLN